MLRLCTYRLLLILHFAIACTFAVPRGQAAQRSPDYDSRIAALELERRSQPQNLMVLRTLADSYGMGAEYGKAISVVKEILAIVGANPGYTLRLAQLYAWTGKQDAALEELGKLGGRAGVEGLDLECQILTAERRAANAASCYERLAPQVMNDSIKYSAVLLAMARNQVWSGRNREAIQSYERYLRIQTNDRTATIELIRLSRYQGDYARAEKLCNVLLQHNPADAEVLAQKAEVLHWAGHRKITARRSAEEALALEPNLPDAKVAQVYALLDVGANCAARQQFLALRDQLSRSGKLQLEASFHDAYRLLEKELAQLGRPELSLPFSTYNDVDGIHDTFTGLEFSVPLDGDHQFRLNLQQYVSSAPWPGTFTAGRNRATVREFSANTTIWAKPGVLMTLAAGSSMKSGSDAARPIFGWHLRFTPADHWTIDVSAGREFLKLTPRTIDRNISDYQTASIARYAFDSRTALSVQAERRWWSDGNRSTASAVIFDRTLHYYKRFMLHGGFLTRHEMFHRDMKFASGFFTPDHYQRHEGYLGANGEARRLRWEMQASGGAQQVVRTAAYRPSWDVTSSLSLRLIRAFRLSGNYQRRNYSLLAKDGWYQGFYFTLGIQP